MDTQRFGKTFATYQLAKTMGWKKILVLTFKPAVQSAWEDDLKSHIDFEGWQFISKKDGEDPSLSFLNRDKDKPVVWFAESRMFHDKSFCYIRDCDSGRVDIQTAGRQREIWRVVRCALFKTRIG